MEGEEGSALSRRGATRQVIRTYPQATATVVPTLSSHPHNLSALSVSEPKQLTAKGKTMNTWRSETTWMFLTTFKVQRKRTEAENGSLLTID